MDRKIVVQEFVEPMYYVQCQAPAGNWYDSLGSQSLDTCLSHMRHYTKLGKTCRLVEKTIRVIEIV